MWIRRGIGKPFFLCCLGSRQPPKHLLAASPKIRSLCLSAQLGCKELPTQMAHRLIPLGLHIPTHQGTTRWRETLRVSLLHSQQATSSTTTKNFYLNAKLSGLPRFSSFTQHFIFNPRNTHGVSRKHEVGALQQNGTHYRFLLSLHPKQALCWTPSSTPVGKGLTHRSPREAAGPFFFPSAPPRPCLRLPPLPALCPDLAGSVPHPSWAA